MVLNVFPIVIQMILKKKSLSSKDVNLAQFNLGA